MSCIFPDKLKIAKVTPIYKKNDKKQVTSYRPISLLPVGYELANLTVHPPPKLSRVGSFFSYRCLVFPKKCPQRKACTFRSYLG